MPGIEFKNYATSFFSPYVHRILTDIRNSFSGALICYEVIY